MTISERIILETRLWRIEKESLDSSYFSHLASRTRPSLLWIEPFGNLAPVAELINTEPADIQVYRSVGALCKPDDLNLMAVLEEFLDHEHPKFIIVCGHSLCQATKDVVAGKDSGLYTGRWLEDLRALHELNAAEISALAPRQQEKKLGELNVQQQVLNLKNLDLVQGALAKGRNLAVHGWYFDLSKGDVQELCSMTRRDLIAPVEAGG